ncbi:MAG: ABC transporter ATP-binding protein [Bacillota bacterium]
MKALIEVCEVHKSIEQNKILNSINLNVKKGSIFGLIGPNGAGKTSLIKILTGIWEPDEGLVRFKGSDVFENVRIKESIGYVPDLCHYYDSFRVKEIIRFYKLAYKRFSEERFQELNKLFQVSTNKRISGLSKGTKAKLMFMLSLSIMPEYLILDEPTSGLDPIAKRRFMETLLDEVSERGTTVLISTHNLADVEQICDSIAVISSGGIKFHGTVDEIKHKVRKLQVVFKDCIPKGLADMEDILSVKT